MGLNRQRAKEHMKYSTARRLENLIKNHVEAGGEIEEITTQSGLLKGPEFPYCAKNTDLGELGPAIPVYLRTYLYYGLIVLFSLLIFIPVMAVSYKDEGDDVRSEWGDFSFYLSWCWTAGNAPPNSIDDKLPVIFTLVMTIAVVFSIPRLLYIQERTALRCDIDKLHPNDYTLMVEGLPLDAIDESEIAEFFSIPHNVRTVSLGEEEAVKFRRKVVKVVIGYDITEHSSTVAELDKIQAKLNKSEHPENQLLYKCCGGCCQKCTCFDENDLYGCCISEERTVSKVQREATYKTQIKELEARLHDLHNLSCKSLKSSGFAFVTFRQQNHLREAEKEWDDTFRTLFARFSCGCLSLNRDLFRNKHEIRAKRAPNPSDINWNNLGITVKTRRKRALLGTFIFACITAASATIVWQLIQLNLNTREDTDSNFWVYIWSLILSFLPGWGISLVNSILWSVCEMTVDYEKHPTVTARNVSLVFKLSICLTMNTALVYIIVQNTSSKWYVEGGLVENVFVQLLFVIFYDPLYRLADPFGRLPRWFAKCFVRERSTWLTQEEYEGMWVAPDYSIAGRFAFINKTVIVTLLYLPIFPFGGVLALIGLVMNYLVDKWCLIRHNRRPKALDKEIGLAAVRIFQILFIMVPGFSIYFLKPHLNGSKTLTISGAVGCALTGFFALFCPNSVQQKLCFSSFGMPTIEENFDDEPSYYDAQQCFPLKYHTTNPIYMGMSESQNPETILEHEIEGFADATPESDDWVDLKAENLRAESPISPGSAAAASALLYEYARRKAVT